MAAQEELDVNYVAKLARLHLSPEERSLFQRQLTEMLRYAEKLKEVDARGIDVAAHTIPIFDVLREDESRPSFSPKQALSNAPRQANGLFLVPKVVG